MPSVNIIAYPPGAGGNHLKNLADLSHRFDRQWPWTWVSEQTVGLLAYNKPQQPQGTVHSLPGRNIHQVFVDHISQNLQRDYIIHGHFGELAAHAPDIRSWPNTRWLVITINESRDRQLLLDRQTRLQYHPYWMDEEQIFIYQKEMYQYYFAAEYSDIHTLALSSLWHKDLAQGGVLEKLKTAFDLDIDFNAAQKLHTIWYHLNFGGDYNL